MRRNFAHFPLKMAALWAMLFLTTPSAALASPIAKGIGLQDPATPVAEKMHEFHTILLYIITAIVIFVLGLLIFIIVRFNAKANPEPSKTTHNVLLEIIWTVVPILILLGVSFKSLPLLFYGDRVEKPELTLKVTGYQWNWGYEYTDSGISFLSYMVKDADIDKTKNQVRLLSTDNPVVLPVDTNIQFLITAQDVIHSFAVPAFGVKMDAVPGRTNESWARITKPGIYYGQCSELCGKDHAFMPIEIHAVSKEDYAAWLEEAKQKFASGDAMPPSPLNNPVKLAIKISSDQSQNKSQGE